jgi:hypothetical protein
MEGDYLWVNMLFVKGIGRIINFTEKDWLLTKMDTTFLVTGIMENHTESLNKISLVSGRES